MPEFKVLLTHSEELFSFRVIRRLGYAQNAYINDATGGGVSLSRKGSTNCRSAGTDLCRAIPHPELDILNIP